MSQKHGAITWNGERWQIVDLGSSNGTTVNDAELEEMVHRSRSATATSS